jgi:hypothetical protein
LLEPESASFSGLQILSPAFLSGNTAKAKALLLIKEKTVKVEIDGIFLHPGLTNTPGSKEVGDFLERLPKDLKAIGSKIVAFTHSGDSTHQVHCLHGVWEWLARDEDAQTSVPTFDYESLIQDFRRLRRSGNVDLLVELSVLAQGCVDAQVAKGARSGFADKLKKQFEGNASWLKQDGVFSDSVETLLGAHGTNSLSAESVKPFLTRVRQYLKDLRKDESRGKMP